MFVVQYGDLSVGLICNAVFSKPYRMTDDGAIILGAATSSPVQTLDIPVGQVLFSYGGCCIVLLLGVLYYSPAGGVVWGGQQPLGAWE